jgi:tungstate transport system substrate-binding protein
MKRLIVPVLAALFLITAPSAEAKECKAVYGKGSPQIRVATGSPGELGLVEQLAEVFNEEQGTSLCWIKAGSGASLKLLKEKQVDAVLVHAPAAEKKAVEEGWATGRKLIGANEFYLVGPESDPAGVKGSGSVAEAYSRIAETEDVFLSRGDNSGTHKKEMAIWKKAGIEPAGDWYVTTNDFMLATLLAADERSGHFMTDSSTWVAAKKDIDNLAILFSGDPFIVNTYHGLCQPEGATDNAATACQFVRFVASEEGQQVIRSYGKEQHGEAMYNDAEYAKQFDH